MNPKVVMRILAKTDAKTKLRLAKILPKLGKADEVTRCMLCPNMCLHVCPVFDAERRLTVSPSVKSRRAYFADDNPFKAVFHCLPCNACKEVCPMDISVNDILRKHRSGKAAEKIAAKIERELLRRSRKVDDRDGRILYFPGCRTFEAQLFDVTVEILEKQGMDFAVRSDAICCGMPYYELGLFGRFADEIQKVREIAKDYDGVISSCPHCVAIMRENGIKAAHIIHVLKPVRVGGECEYHDPCILARQLNLVDQPRELLRQMGVEVHDPLFSGKNTYCCGYGGIYRFLDENRVDKISRERKSHFTMEVVTACPGCKMGIEAKDIVELIREGI